MVLIEDKEEVSHVISMLREAQRALQKDDALELKQLSDQTIHSATIHQHTDFILIAVILYSLNKLTLRKESINAKKWGVFVKRFNAEIDKAIEELKNRELEEFARHIEHSKSLLKDLSPTLKQDIEEVVRKACVNKAGRIYEHGISLPRTAKLLGVTQWELAEYIGQRIPDNAYLTTIDIKKRAQVALEFFS